MCTDFLGTSPRSINVCQIMDTLPGIGEYSVNLKLGRSLKKELKELESKINIGHSMPFNDYKRNKPIFSQLTF